MHNQLRGANWVALQARRHSVQQALRPFRSYGQLKMAVERPETLILSPHDIRVASVPSDTVLGRWSTIRDMARSLGIAEVSLCGYYNEDTLLMVSDGLKPGLCLHICASVGTATRATAVEFLSDFAAKLLRPIPVHVLAVACPEDRKTSPLPVIAGAELLLPVGAVSRSLPRSLKHRDITRRRAHKRRATTIVIASPHCTRPAKPESPLVRPLPAALIPRVIPGDSIPQGMPWVLALHPFVEPPVVPLFASPLSLPCSKHGELDNREVPRDICMIICSSLQAADLCHLSQVSTSWMDVALDPDHWHRLCTRHFGHCMVDTRYVSTGLQRRSMVAHHLADILFERDYTSPPCVVSDKLKWRMLYIYYTLWGSDFSNLMHRFKWYDVEMGHRKEWDGPAWLSDEESSWSADEDDFARFEPKVKQGRGRVDDPFYSPHRLGATPRTRGSKRKARAHTNRY